jgi:hypothetical protein
MKHSDGGARNDEARRPWRRRRRRSGTSEGAGPSPALRRAPAMVTYLSPADAPRRKGGRDVHGDGCACSLGRCCN